MLAQYFGLEDEPFSDEASSTHDFTTLNFRGVHAQLLAAIGERRGLILLFGESGAGKSAALRLLHEELGAGAAASLSCRAETTFDEILGAACTAFGVAPSAPRRAEIVRALVAEAMHRLRAGRPMALLLDDADALDDAALESLHLLSQAGDRKLLQVVLAARPTLETRLRRAQLRALDDDAAVRCRLAGLDDEEVAAYIRHRLRRAGQADAQLFPPPVIERIARCTRGNARQVDAVARQALLLAKLEGSRAVTLKAVDQAASVLGLEGGTPPTEAPAAPSSTVAPMSIYRSRPADEAVAAPVAASETTSDAAEEPRPKEGRPRPAFPEARLLAAQSRLRSAAQFAPPAPSRRLLPVVVAGIALALTTILVGGLALHLLRPDLTAAWLGNDAPSRLAATEATPPGPDGVGRAGSSAPTGAGGDQPTLRLLIERGDELLATGDIASARLFFERAAALGSAAAATAAGKSNDPSFLEERGVHGIPADEAAAERWYRIAAQAGDDEAPLLLQALQARRRAAR
jgi:general secretion pathway protein A